MTGEELKAIIAERIERDPRLRKIRAKTAKGKATKADSFTYSRICSEIMSEELAKAVLDLDDREGICAALLRESYGEIMQTAEAIQRSIDEKQGIHMQPRRPAFPAERVQQIAHSLVDPTVPDEKIVRRAGSTATVSMSFHDDFVQENAAFRAKAGLKCWITRETDGKCCPWCSALAGRYEYGEEPEEVYHRHDNCGCTVTYENGRQRQDVWSKRTWEAPEPGAGAKKPAVLSQEQAQALQEKHGLTIPAGRGRIQAEDDSIALFRGADALPKEQVRSLEEAVSVIPASLLEQLSKYVSRIRIEEGRGYSSYNRETHEIILDRETGAQTIVHELGHAFGDMLGLYDEPEFLDILADGLDLSSWGDVIPYPHPYNPSEHIFILPQSNGSKLLEPYQGRVYGSVADWREPISPRQLREYISVAFDAFFKAPEILKEKDPRLFHYLEARIYG